MAHLVQLPHGSWEDPAFWRTSVQLQILQTSEQFIHCRVENASSSFAAYVTIVYARNEALNRRSLWADLILLGRKILGYCVVTSTPSSLQRTEFVPLSQ